MKETVTRVPISLLCSLKDSPTETDHDGILENAKKRLVEGGKLARHRRGTSDHAAIHFGSDLLLVELGSRDVTLRIMIEERVVLLETALLQVELTGRCGCQFPERLD